MKHHATAALICVLSALAVFPALAQNPEEQAIDAAIACRDIQDPMERLACLDSAAETLAVTRIVREEEAVQQAKEEREQFGLARKPDETESQSAIAETEAEFGGESVPELRQTRDEGRLRNRTAKIAEVRVRRNSKLTLTLENGQVWRQLDSDSSNVIFPQRDQLYTARIKRSIMGNYMITIEELRRTIRVRRVQ